MTIDNNQQPNVKMPSELSMVIEKGKQTILSIEIEIKRLRSIRADEESNIINLRTQVSNLTDEIKTLTDTKNTLESDIKLADENLNTINGSIATANKNLEKVNSQIVKDRVAADSMIKEAKTRLDNASEIEKLAINKSNEIGRLEKLVEDREKAIVEFAKKITS